MFIEMLNSCKTESRFFSFLDVGLSSDATFYIIEKNSFRDLAHLILKLKQGNDESLKKHLSTQIKDMKHQNELLRSEVCSL